MREERWLRSVPVSFPEVGRPSRLVERGLSRLSMGPILFDRCANAYSCHITGLAESGLAVGYILEASDSDDLIQKPAFWERGRLNFLDVQQGWEGEANDVNAFGLAVGTMHAEGCPQAILWRDGRATPLADVFGPHWQSEALGVNDLGQVVGTMFGPETIPDDEQGEPEWVSSFLWEGNQVQLLRGLEKARAVNNSGVVVGGSVRSVVRGESATVLPVVWREGRVEDLDLRRNREESVYLQDINDRAEIVGVRGGWSREQCRECFVWRDGEVTVIVDALPDKRADRLRINNAGIVVGLMNGDQRPVYWDGQALVELALPQGTKGRATAVNNRGEIGGVVCNDASGERPCTWRIGS